jgi:hypothetical protein
LRMESWPAGAIYERFGELAEVRREVEEMGNFEG